MPIFIRAVIQRLFVLILSVLAFFGISPEVNVPTDEQAEIAQEERDESIKNYFDTVEEEQDKADPVIEDSPTPPIQFEMEPEPEIEKTFTPTFPNIITETKNLIDENLNANLSGAENTLVNIICLNRDGARIEAHTGSGVLIDSRGVVLTNAHVAQFFLLESSSNKNFMDCNLYKENIPTYGYTAKLLYISPRWVQKNYSLIRDPNPKGTGEEDFAFLYITGNTNPTLKNPKSFQNANFSTNFKYKVGSKVFVAGYPGAPANINQLTKSVKLKTDSTYISDVFTLGRNTIDVIATGPTEVAQKGASGGGLFSNDNLIAMTTTVSEDESGTKINALTTEYINRNLFTQENLDVKKLLAADDFNSDLNFKVDSFYEKEVPDMRKILLKVY